MAPKAMRFYEITEKVNRINRRKNPSSEPQGTPAFRDQDIDKNHLT